MKKKVWDITVKDNPNRVVMGENDEFYTTDTEAYLVFNLQDKDFNPQSAMLTLENLNDGSLKSEEVEVVGSNITWEMPGRYIEHSGNWQAQLVYEQMKGEVPEKYTSGVMAFTVNGHIQDKKRPGLVEIENWEKFIADGTELIETWEDLEALREENERQRQANEQGRESAESVRVANEEERELNEAERISKDSERDSKVEAVEGNLESKANKKQEDWITPTLLNGWTQHSTYVPLRYMKDELGFVHLQGHLVAGTDRDVLLLPLGYRPEGSMEYIINTSYNVPEINICWITSGGRLFVRQSGRGTMVSVNITFKSS